MASLGPPANFNGFRVLPSLLQRRRSLQANQTLHDAWPSPALIHYIIINMHFWRHLPLTEFCPVQNSLYVQVLRSSILAALLHGTPAAGVSQTLREAWYKEWNYRTFTEAPPIFGWADIALGIGPHSSFTCYNPTFRANVYIYCIAAIYGRPM